MTEMVIQEWVARMPWKQQSILFSGLRGPDLKGHPAIKKVSKWMRMVSQNNADPSKQYMEVTDLPTPEEISDELEYLTCHFAHHFADALAVIAYSHPDREISHYAFSIHAHFAEEVFHFIPEHPQIFRWRHRDKPDGLDSNPRKPFNDRSWMNSFLPEGYVHP